MTRAEIFKLIEKERAYQDAKWGTEFDDKNTPNDWVSYISIYLGKAVTMPWDREAFRTAILKVVTLGVAILEREGYAPRHYDPKEVSTSA
jgi:hypothetical protein